MASASASMASASALAAPPPALASLPSLLEAAQQPWLNAAEAVCGSLLYLDAGAAEAARDSCGGARFLLGLGALGACALEGASPDDARLASALDAAAPVATLTFAITSLLTEASAGILAAAAAHPSARRLVVLSALSEQAQAWQLGAEGFDDYAEALAERLLPRRLEVEVRHAPLLGLSALDGGAFALCSAGAAARLSRAAGMAARADGPGDGGGDEAALLAHEAAALAAALGRRPEAFGIGPAAQRLARELAALPPPRAAPGASAAPPPIAVVFVDRSLDLASPSARSGHWLDAALALLPPLEAAEALRAPFDARARAALGSLLARSDRDAALLLRRWLKEALRAEGVPPPVRAKAGAAAAGELRAYAEALAGRRGQRWLAAMGAAAAAALEAPGMHAWLASASAQRQLLAAAAADDGAGLLATCLDACAAAGRSHGLLDASDALELLLCAYSACGGAASSPFTLAGERQLREALGGALAAAMAAERSLRRTGAGGGGGGGPLRALPALAAAAAAAASSGGGGAEPEGGEYAAAADRLAASDAAGEAFVRLRAAAAARATLRDLRSLLPSGASGGDVFGGGGRAGAELSPLLAQLVERLALRSEVPDAVPAAPAPSALKGLLGLGLGRLRAGLQGGGGDVGGAGGGGGGGGAGARGLHEHEAVLIFVVGGISVSEARAVRRVLDRHPVVLGPPPAVVVGGSRWLAPGDAAAAFFGAPGRVVCV